METVFWGVLSVGVSVALALAGFVVVRRLVPLDLREVHNTNTAVMFGALYVMYGLIVGFSAYLVSYQVRHGPEDRPGRGQQRRGDPPRGRRFPQDEAAGGPDLDENRGQRLLEVREGIPSILWAVLVLGGAVTVCFTYLSG